MMDYQQDPNSLRIQIYWNPPPTHIYDVGDRDSMDAALAVLREQVEASIAQDPMLGQLSEDQLTIEQGWIGPQAQAIDTIDIVLRNLHPDFLQQVQDIINNLRHGFVESAFTSLGRLFSLTSDYLGIDLNATVVFEHEMYGHLQPSVLQELHSPLLSFSMPYPEHLEAGTAIWNSWIESANSIDEDFQSGIAEYLSSNYDLQETRSVIEVQSVVQPPMSGPPIDTFFIDVSQIITALVPIIGQAAAENAVGKAIDAGIAKIKESWPGGFPSDQELNLTANRNELLRRVKLHMASEGYSGLPDESYTVTPHNRRIKDGFHRPIDQNAPMGWIVQVHHQDGRWEFKILNSPRRVERKTFTNADDLIATTVVNLMADHGDLYDPNIPQ